MIHQFGQHQHVRFDVWSEMLAIDIVVTAGNPQALPFTFGIRAFATEVKGKA